MRIQPVLQCCLYFLIGLQSYAKLNDVCLKISKPANLNPPTPERKTLLDNAKPCYLPKLAMSKSKACNLDGRCHHYRASYQSLQRKTRATTYGCENLCPHKVKKLASSSKAISTSRRFTTTS